MSNTQQTTPVKKNALGQIIGFLIVVMLIVFGATVASRLATTSTSDIQKIAEQKVVEVIKEKKVLVTRPTCENTYNEFKSLKEKGQSLQLTSSQWTHGENGKLLGVKHVVVAITGKDDIACGYLYVKASANSKPLEEKYDSVYIDPQDFGGHLLKSKSLIPSPTSTFTEFLLPLNAVSFLPNLPYNPNAQDYRIADWATLLNVNSHAYFDIALSTANKSGLLEDVTLAYKCWDTQTGEESKNCQLSLEK